MPSRAYSQKYNLVQWMTVVDQGTDRLLLQVMRQLAARHIIDSGSRYALVRYALKRLLEENGVKQPEALRK